MTGVQTCALPISAIDQENLNNILKYNISILEIADVDPITKGSYLIDTLNMDKNDSKMEAINDIYRVLRPGEPPSFEVANEIFNKLFFTSERYDLSDVGRVKLNSKLELKCNDNITILRNDDIVAIIKHMLDLKDGKGEVDDIDHLGNRRVRSVGELVENQFRSEEHTSELQSRTNLVCRLLLEKKKKKKSCTN